MKGKILNMRDHYLARLQAKIFLKRNFKSLFGLYFFCRASYSLVYILLCLAAMFFFKDHSSYIVYVKTTISVISILFSTPVIFGLIERYKQKHFPEIYDFSQPVSYSIFMGIVVAAFSLSNFIAVSDTWRLFISPFFSFIGTEIFAPFFAYNLLVRPGTFLNQLSDTKELVKETGFTYIKNLVAFIPLYFLSYVVIVQLPVAALYINVFSSWSDPFLSLLAEEATVFVFTFIAVLPVYMYIKLYCSIYFLFAQGEEEFDFKDYLD